MPSLKDIAENKIISKVTASIILLSGIFMITYHMTTATVNAEVLAVGALIVGSAGTFLFMSEK